MNINDFKKFRKESKIQPTIRNKTIWGYTRVSSKEQFQNSSIEEQKEDIIKYAKKNNYEITHFHGGTFESAKGDLSRKEFRALIENVRNSKRKPYAIAIKFISRFSRTGGNAIAILEELVNDLNIHLIETQSGITTEHESGLLEIQRKLLISREENLLRMQRTIPGLKKFIEGGKYLGRAPRGYDLHGPRVKDFSKRSEHQFIKINEEGKILRNAWKWKSEGMRDTDIRRKLCNKYNFKITKQNLSQMWRRPFYVGVNVNALSDVPVKGDWPPLIDMKIWEKVQRILDQSKRKSGYATSPINIHRPLTGFVRCGECGAKITSYIAKKKQVHYYKCQHGKGGNMNAYTTPRSKKIGVNDAFSEFLSTFKLDNVDRTLLEDQIKLLTNDYNLEQTQSKDALENALQKLESKLEKVDEKYLLTDTLTEAAYEKVKCKLESEIKEVKSKLSNSSVKLSNQENIINRALDFCQNMSNYWSSADINQKIAIQHTLFPEGVIINPETRQYRTKKMNRLLSAIEDIARDSENKSNKKSHRNGGLSFLVAGTGLERLNHNDFDQILECCKSFHNRSF